MTGHAPALGAPRGRTLLQERKAAFDRGAHVGGGDFGGIAVAGAITLTLTPTNRVTCGTAPFVVPVGDVLLTLTERDGRLSGTARVVQCDGQTSGTASFARPQ